MLKSAIKARNTKQHSNSSAGNRQSKRSAYSASASPAERACINKGILCTSSYSVPRLSRLANALSCHGFCEAACCEPFLQEEHTRLNKKMSQVFRVNIGRSRFHEMYISSLQVACCIREEPSWIPALCNSVLHPQRSAAAPDHLRCICSCQLVQQTCLLCILRGPAEPTRMLLVLSPFLQCTLLRALAETTRVSLQLSASHSCILRGLAQTIGNAAADVCLPFLHSLCFSPNHPECFCSFLSACPPLSNASPGVH